MRIVRRKPQKMRPVKKRRPLWVEEDEDECEIPESALGGGKK
jgi:hypothetical protein